MAQHIPTTAFKQKRFRAIEKGIINDFKGFGVRGSLKYDTFDQRISDHNAEHELQEVYFCERSIPKGIVWGTNRGNLQIHFNKITRKVEQIYLVA